MSSSQDSDAPHNYGESFNTTSLEEMCGYDLQIAQEVIAEYMESAPSLLAKIGGAVESGNAPDLTLHAHSLKGASRTIGAEAMAQICLQLEMAGKQESLAETPTLLRYAQQEWDHLRPQLCAYLAKEAA
jgi:two-component system sensor histidine kinase/response regulator